MRVLIAHNDYGRPSGEEHACEAIAGLLAANGHKVSWFRRSSTEIDKTLAGKAKAFFAGVANPWAARRMARVLDEEKPDLVFVQNLYPLLSPGILAPCSRRRIPVVMRCPNYRLFCPSGLHLSHGEVCERCLGGREYWCVLRNCERDLVKSAGYALRGWAARVTGRILNNVDIFIVLSEFQRQRFIAQGIPPERVEILPNITPEVGAGCREEGAGGESGKTESGEQKADISTFNFQLSTFPSGYVAFVGRASPEKGIEDFVEAARRLPDLPFAVAGATERMPWLVGQSPPNLRWLGFLNEEKLNEFYRQSRILVCPYRWYEGFPNVVTHAMALRRPVIAARIGVLPELLEDGRTGLLFDTGNVTDMVDKIRTLYPDVARCRAMGEAGREKALTHFSRDAVYRQLIRICEKACGRGVSPDRDMPPTAIAHPPAGSGMG